MRSKKSLLLRYKIVRLFNNALTADDKLYLLNRGNLTQPIQMQLSQKQKTFSKSFFCFFLFGAFSRSILNFTHFSKKDDPHRGSISAITESGKRPYINV